MTDIPTNILIYTLLSRVQAHVLRQSPFGDVALQDIDAVNEQALECLHVTLKSAHKAMMDAIEQRQAEYFLGEESK